MANRDLPVFVEYEKMSTSLSTYENHPDFKKKKWMVTEKVHGANFSVHTDGQTVTYAKRRFLIDNGENFFNFRTAECMETLPEKVKEMFGLVCQHVMDDEVTQVSIYGELFGGLYNHLQVQAAPGNMKPVQREVQYSPTINWMAFDISYRTKDRKQHDYIDAEVCLELFSQLDIPHLKPLFIGSMNDALNYKLGFDSTVPAYFGLPALPKGSNKAEGVVVKPMQNIMAINKHEEEQRVIVKLKIEEFTECVPKKKEKGKSVNKAAQKNKNNILVMLMPLTNEQRLISAISKIGPPDDPKSQQAIENEFVQDVLTDACEFSNDTKFVWDSMTENERVKTKDIIQKKAKGLIKKYNTNR